MNIKTSISLRLRITFIFMVLFSSAIVYKMVHIQNVDNGKWKAKAKSTGLEFREIKAIRGNIYSDNGSLLATSLPFYKVAFDPSLAKDEIFKSGLDSLAFLLSKHFKDQSYKTYKRYISDARLAGKKYIIINRKKIKYQTKKMMSSWPIFNRGRMKGGVIFEKMNERFHPFSYLGYRTIGTVNKINNRGIVGLEYSFNRQLAGKDGEALFQKMVGGSWKPVYDNSEVKPKDGYDIVTTININLQDIAESALLSALIKHDADYGSVILMEVSTGEIKAISNLSKNKNGKYRENYNYAVGSQGVKEPGSTFKLASMIALFEDSKISLYDSIETGNGKFDFYDKTMKDHKPGGFGKLSIKEVFEKSSNIGIAKLINKQFSKSPQQFINYLNNMGLTKPLGFQMIGEGKPYIKNPSDTAWSGITLPWMSHGYELQITPLHMLSLFNAIANNGKLIRPLIVKYIKTADKIIETYETKIINKKICSEVTLTKVKEMLEGVVERGTAQNIKDSYYKIAGKTGTAKNLINGKYSNNYYTSFAGYFPAKNPKYSCIVIINNPKGYRIYGSDVAAPTFKEIADNIYTLDLELNDPYKGRKIINGVFPVIQAGEQKSLSLICNEIGISNYTSGSSEWVKAKINGNSILWNNIKEKKNFVPDVCGMTLRDALYLLENKGLKVNYNGTGRVSQQSLLPGNNKTIKLKLG